MYYLLRANDGEAFCAIVIPEVSYRGGDVTLSPLYAIIQTDSCLKTYSIQQADNRGMVSENIGTVNIHWTSRTKIPSWKNIVHKSVIPLEKISKAQFETYALLGLPYVTREDQNPFNKLAMLDIE